MLTRDQLAELYRGLQQEQVLTVYVDGVGKDPARRRVWRRRLEQELEREANRLDFADSKDREAFEAARGRVLRELDGFQSFLPKKGFVAFATADALHHWENLPVQVPTLVRWEAGPRVAPYIRGLKQLRPMVTALVDGRRGRVFLYKEGELSEVMDLRADTFMGDLSESASSRRASKHSGSRGETATDAAQRYLEVGAERMLREVKELICDLAGGEGFVLLGGEQEALATLRPLLPRSMEHRILENPSLWLDMSLAEVKAATAEGASALSKRRQESLLDQVLAQAYAKGNGCLGGEDTMIALEKGSVDILLLSRSFVRGSPDLADQCVAHAFRHSADVRVLSGDPAGRLDEAGGGIGARLRYRPEGVGEMAAQGVPTPPGA
jgi:hypothetical protein